MRRMNARRARAVRKKESGWAWMECVDDFHTLRVADETREGILQPSGGRRGMAATLITGGSWLARSAAAAPGEQGKRGMRPAFVC